MLKKIRLRSTTIVLLLGIAVTSCNPDTGPSISRNVGFVAIIHQDDVISDFLYGGPVTSATANFQRITWGGPLPQDEVKDIFKQLQIDTCQVVLGDDIEGEFGGGDGGTPINIEQLDVGNPGTIIAENRTDIVLEWNPALRMYMSSLTPEYAAGDMLEVYFPSGEDIEEFFGEVKLIGPPVFTQPIIENGRVEIDFNQSLPLEWNDDIPGDNINITIFMGGGACYCSLRDDGEFTIPDALLSQLPYTEGQYYQFSAYRQETENTLVTTEPIGAYVQLWSYAQMFAQSPVGKKE